MLGKFIEAKHTLSRGWWTLHRFGFSPQKIWYRLTDRSGPKILCVSIPKAGTHLLERALCLHPRLYRKLAPTINDNNIQEWNGLAGLLETVRRGEIVISHLSFTSDRREAVEARDIRCVFLIRDPRDIIISQTFYILRSERHALHQLFYSQSDFKDSLKLAIEGCPEYGLPSIRQRLEDFAGWLRGGCLVLRFEDLIGPQGGGDSSAQFEVLRSIYNFIELDVNQSRIGSIRQGLFSSVSPTFRKGTLDQWKRHFDAEIKALFKKLANDALIQYGYESTDNW